MQSGDDQLPAELFKADPNLAADFYTHYSLRSGIIILYLQHGQGKNHQTAYERRSKPLQ